jgi:hypothetical protein
MTETTTPANLPPAWGEVRDDERGALAAEWLAPDAEHQACANWTSRRARPALVGYVAASKGVCLARREPDDEPGNFVDDEHGVR